MEYILKETYVLTDINCCGNKFLKPKPHYPILVWLRSYQSDPNLSDLHRKAYVEVMDREVNPSRLMVFACDRCLYQYVEWGQIIKLGYDLFDSMEW